MAGMLTYRRGAGLLILGFAGSGCRYDTAAPATSSEVAGAYHAITFTTSRAGITTDQLGRGVRLTITLAADGGTSGMLFLPADVGGTDATIDLAGTWAQAGPVIHFDQEADSFVREVPFVPGPGVLQGDTTIRGFRVRVTLVRDSEDSAGFLLPPLRQAGGG